MTVQVREHQILLAEKEEIVANQVLQARLHVLIDNGFCLGLIVCAICSVESSSCVKSTKTSPYDREISRKCEHGTWNVCRITLAVSAR